MTGNPNGRPKQHHKTNLEAVKVTIRQMEGQGWLTPADAALVTYVLTTAAAVDATPSRAILRKEYREALTELRRLGSKSDGGFGELLGGLRAEMGDAAALGASNARPAGRRDHAEARDAADAVAGTRVGRRLGVVA